MAKHAGHDEHDGDGMAHHRLRQHELFHGHHATEAEMGPMHPSHSGDQSGPPDGAAHNSKLFAGLPGERAFDGIAGESGAASYHKDGGAEGGLRKGDSGRGGEGEHGGKVYSVNNPGGSSC